MRTRNKLIGRLLAAACLASLAASAHAGSAQVVFTVSGTVVPTCSISAAALSFGTAINTPVNANIDATANITATCSSAAAYTVALSTGANSDYSARKMSAGGGNTLSYNLYLDASRSTIWGDGTGSTLKSNQSGTGAAQTLTVYGRIPLGQSPVVGTYQDNITATITF